MITKKELNEVTLSPTKKDYYQIWNELLDLASKISDRWTPANTNESDPGIVLLKALTAIADKLNYNIDKNTLEAFMPSATQEESMRKLTEMMGYTMKHYLAATCEVSFKFKETEELSINDYPEGIWFPRFLNLTNEDEDINFVTLNAFNISPEQPFTKVMAIEGELIVCESDSDNVVTLKHLDDNNRYLLPELAIAENGIFITNISNNLDEDIWERVDTLNDKFAGSRIFKFGFDSNKKLPYIQFPEDISHLIKSGLKIQYIRTRGRSGNISANTISKFNIPNEWSEVSEEYEKIKELTAENFTVKNITSAINGADPESLNQAYNNYKKVIGTFDTLVTCRDYMNKIYQLKESEYSSAPLVSNIIVSDIRDDINNAITLCSFNDYGICYSNKSLQNSNSEDLIDHCDLILYPFKAINNLNDKREYINSFTYTAANNDKIKTELDEIKTISHSFKELAGDDIVCIKNYLKLKAQVYTKKKVTFAEGEEILQNIKNSIYENFNARQLDFGEEIPYDTIFEVMVNADSRIKDINLDEPILNTKILTGKNNEYDLVSMSDSNKLDKKLYNKLVLRNVLAGRIAAFSYNDKFQHDYRDVPYTYTYTETDSDEEITETIDSCYSNEEAYIYKLESSFEPPMEYVKPFKLEDNQVIQFRMPNLKTTMTYPAYVNYYFYKSKKENHQPYYPASFQNIYDFIVQNEDTVKSFWKANSSLLTTIIAPESETDIEVWKNKIENTYGTYLVAGDFEDDENNDAEVDEPNTVETNDTEIIEDGDRTVWVLELNNNTLYTWSQFFIVTCGLAGDISGIYKNNGVDLKKIPGYLIDSSKMSYTEITTINTNYADGIINHFYVPIKRSEADIPEDRKTDLNVTEYGVPNEYTWNGLGRNGEDPSISINSSYQLQEGDYLLINYSDSSDTKSDEKEQINRIYTAGTIIKPNFELISSDIYKNNHSYSKKDNFNFLGYSPEGLFTLGANDQLEIQEIERVELDGVANLYWILNTDDPSHTSSTLKFTEKYFDDLIKSSDYIEETTTNADGNKTHTYYNNAYTLKDGEYLFYSDSKKTDLAYYGSGTIVVKGSGYRVNNLTRDNYNNISIEAVEENGLSANIPWNTFNLQKSNNTTIYVIGTQSITLTAGDTIEFISKDEINKVETNHAILDLERNLTSNWQDIKSAKYRFAENGTSEFLPVVSIGSDSDPAKISWEVCSRLDMNMAAGSPQVLHNGDKITAYFRQTVDDVDMNDLTTTIQPYYQRSNDAQSEIEYIGNPLVLQSNRLVQNATGSVLVSVGTDLTNITNSEIILKDFKLKVTARNEIINKSNNVMEFNNYVNNNYYFTRYTFAGEPSLNNSYKYKIKDSTENNKKFTITLNNPDAASNYYICGPFTKWQPVEKYKLDNDNGEANTKLLSPNTIFSIIKTGINGYSVLSRDTDFTISDNDYIETVETVDADFNLNVEIPENMFGLIMFYWIYDDNYYGSSEENSKIKAEAKIEAQENIAGIRHYKDSENKDTINLNRGFNMIRVDSSVKQLKVYGTCGNLIFDNLTIISGVNPALDYQEVGKIDDNGNVIELSQLEQLEFDLNNLNILDKFYCTAPILPDSAIDLNQLISDDTLLKNSLSWYDTNNINNKFVISEIDADYLNTGITIAKSSRV